ncbi:hypothetical protein CL614_02335 [archaeon]|nr:hypothetical protein [archaeon]|tara:strand:+ start:867 stop:1553 length:687 start_codon:yes stop_codon:yes gene_type:complete
MVNVDNNTTITEYCEFVKDVYGLSNERYFSIWDMMSNIERFAMRGLKGIRKEDYEKAKLNLLISFSWFTSITNKLHIDIEDAVWKRFPFMCSYCASNPCKCKKEKIEIRQKVPIDNSKKPNTLRDYQNMFKEIYPIEARTIEHAGVHLAEELGELSEAILTYRSGHKDEMFKEVIIELADVFSCFIGLFNSINFDMTTELSKMFFDNCHVCHNAPCNCNFNSVIKFKS